MTLMPSAHVDTFCRDNLPPFDTWPEFRFDLPELRYPDRLNCAVALLDDVIDRHGADRTCLLSPDGERWTYGELLATSHRVARVLVEELGIVAGNRVLLRGPNNPWLVACWFGVLKAGAVVVTTMPLLRPGELSTVHEIARIDLALCDHRFTDDLRAADLGDAPIVTYGGDDEADLTHRAAAYDGTGRGFDSVETSSDDVALLAFTSGTTGRPKATMHFHRDVLANADTFSRHVLRPTPDDVFTGTPPLAFTFGLGGLVVFPLHAGASTLLIEKATPDQLADHIAAHDVTICFTAPTAYRAMLLAGRPERLGSLRRCVSAGEHLPAATWQAFYDATGVRIIDGIGYVQNGWNITGDTFRTDEDGYFWYEARSDDMIISSGYNIGGPEVEEALLAHDTVAECAVVGVPDEARGQLVKAYVVLAPGVVGDDTLVKELQEFAKQRIAPYKYPRAIEFIDALPRTSTGKVQRFRLREGA
jgi:2-aminobenzoate-CoA ligase